MNINDVQTGINNYCRSRFSAADDDRLCQLVKNIPGGICLDINGIDTDSCGNPIKVRLSIEKTTGGRWIVKDHWAFESGCKISDDVVGHSLTYLLRCKRVQVKCTTCN